MPVVEREQVLTTFYNQNVFRWDRLKDVTTARVLRSMHDAGLRPHLVTSRVKSLRSFVDKGLKPGADREFKYADPERQITDLVGLRIVVAIAEDVPSLAQVVRAEVHVVEEVHRGNEDEAQAPGYQSLHLVARLRDDDPAVTDYPALAGDACIEIQIRSILQDAYASFLHDLVYKAERQAGAKTQRQLKVLAAVLDLADREFGRVRAEHIGDVDLPEVVELFEESAWDETSLNDAVRQYVGPRESDARPWLLELRAVMLALGLREPKSLDLMSADLAGGPELASALRAKRPWLSGSQVLDVLLQEALGDRYLDARADGLTPEQRTELQQALLGERGLSKGGDRV